MLGQRLRRWPNIDPTLGQCLSCLLGALTPGSVTVCPRCGIRQNNLRNTSSLLYISRADRVSNVSAPTQKTESVGSTSVQRQMTLHRR